MRQRKFITYIDELVYDRLSNSTRSVPTINGTLFIEALTAVVSVSCLATTLEKILSKLLQMPL
mgnify:CR=1 FL=1